jgi:hypothetical protein
MISLLDVIWIDDETVDPPHPKMVVCVNVQDGWFFRINSLDKIRPCIHLTKTPDHSFLHHDSFLDCCLLELDDYIISESVKIRGVIGCLNSNRIQPLIDMVRRSWTLNDGDREIIIALLTPLLQP